MAQNYKINWRILERLGHLLRINDIRKANQDFRLATQARESKKKMRIFATIETGSVSLEHVCGFI